MDEITVRLDSRAARRFNEALRDISAISGKDFKSVLKSEMGAVLNGAIKGTKKATVKSVKRNHDRQPGAVYGLPYPGPQSSTGKIYTPQQVSKANARAARARKTKGKALYYLSGSRQPHRYPDSLWAKITENRAKSLDNHQKTRGLAASMWVKIAAGLGIAVEAPQYVRNATHWKHGDMAGMVQTREGGRDKTYGLGFTNNLTHTNNWAGAGIAFRNALNRRANFFSQAVKLAAKGKIKAVMDRYPGLARVS